MKSISPIAFRDAARPVPSNFEYLAKNPPSGSPSKWVALCIDAIRIILTIIMLNTAPKIMLS